MCLLPPVALARCLSIYFHIEDVSLHITSLHLTLSLSLSLSLPLPHPPLLYVATHTRTPLFLSFLVVLSIRGQGGKKKRKNHGEYRGHARAHGIVVHYPEDIFIKQFSSNQRWREKRATYTETMTKPQDFNNFTRSQDKEDIWLYENYFYGQSGGLSLSREL